MRANVVSIGRIRRAARRGQSRQQQASASAPATVLNFPEPPARIELSADAIDYAERIEMLISSGRSVAAIEIVLRCLERRPA